MEDLLPFLTPFKTVFIATYISIYVCNQPKIGFVSKVDMEVI